MVDDLEVGQLGHHVSIYVTKGVYETIKLWAEIAGWGFSQTARFLLVEAIRSYDGRHWKLERGDDEE